MADRDRDRNVPQTRLGRAARVGRALGGQGVKLAGTGAANVLRGREGSQAALERRHADSAAQMVKALGGLRGAAIKVGQLASFVDVELLPPEYQEIYQRELATLRTHAPPMSWRKVKTVLDEAWDQPVSKLFAEFDKEATAAASIGQVHRAVLKDGRAVAVKIQYPDVADALRADMQNAALFLRLGRMIAPGLDVKAVAKELKERVLEELDYELEAQNQRRFSRAYRDHPFIYVPEVIGELSTERVLVTDWVDGMQFDEILALDQDARDRFGEIVYRFSFGSIYHLRHLNADAHPGNYMLMDDGRVAFIDFGMTKRITESQLRLQVAVARAALENDPEAVAAALEEIGFIRDRTRIDTGMLLEHVKAVGGWYLNGRKTRITSKLVARTIAAMSDPRSQYFSLVRRESLPADELLVRRMETGVLAVLGKLNAAANWTKIGGEWWDADKPATPLGREEWEFFQSRGHVRERLG